MISETGGHGDMQSAVQAGRLGAKQDGAGQELISGHAAQAG
jgi:hypothetical protein